MDEGDEGNELEEVAFARIVQAAPPPLDGRAITRETHLRRDLGLDSLGLASFLLRCGDALGVDADDFIEGIVGPIHTIGDVVAVSARVLGGARP